MHELDALVDTDEFTSKLRNRAHADCRIRKFAGPHCANADQPAALETLNGSAVSGGG
jgi:hypothetical protein